MIGWTVMSPEPLDPLRAMEAAITALEEQVNTRVIAVENGRKFQTWDGGASPAMTNEWVNLRSSSRSGRISRRRRAIFVC